jgi:hypothetical protein
VQLIPFPRRDEAAVMLFRRVIDPENFGPRVYSLLRDMEAERLRARLGGAFTPPEVDEDTKAVVFLTEQQ